MLFVFLGCFFFLGGGEVFFWGVFFVVGGEGRFFGECFFFFGGCFFVCWFFGPRQQKQERISDTS